MVHTVKTEFQGLPHSLGTAGKVYYKSVVSDSCSCPGEHGPWGDLEAEVSYCLGYSRCHPFTDLLRSFRGYIPLAEARSSGCENQLSIQIICHILHLFRQKVLFIRQDYLPDDLIALVLNHFLDDRSGKV